MIHAEQRRFFPGQLQEFECVDFIESLMPAHGVDGRLEQIGIVDTRDFHGVLKSQEYSFACTFFRFQLEQVFALEVDRSARDDVVLVTGDDQRQRALAGAVWPHDRVHFTGVDRQ